MIAIGTNVLVQLLTGDQAEQYKASLALFSHARGYQHPFASKSRRSNLPAALRGRLLCCCQARGSLWPARWARQWRVRDSGSQFAPARSTTWAATRWPRLLSLAPHTPTSSTSGCSASTASTSAGETFSPPLTIKSSRRSSGSYNQIANYVIAQSEINIGIGARPPTTYLAELREQVSGGTKKYGGITDRDELLHNLRMNCIPEAMLDGEVKDYELFLEDRRQLMALKIKRWFEVL